MACSRAIFALFMVVERYDQLDTATRVIGLAPAVVLLAILTPILGFCHYLLLEDWDNARRERRMTDHWAISVRR